MHVRQVVRGVTAPLLFGVLMGLVGCADDEDAMVVRAPGPPPPPEEVLTVARGQGHAAGPTVIHSAASPGLCVDAAGDRAANHTQVRLYPCHGRENQRWNFAPGERGALAVTGIGGLCLDVSRHSDYGNKVQLFECTGAPNQQYAFEPDGRLKELGTGRCLAPTALEPRAPIVAEPCDPAAPAQVWSMSDH
jgi:hypothetical protein